MRTTALVGDGWDRPGLGEWDVRVLVGHTSRALVTVETYLARPAAAADVASAPEYFRATRAAAAGPAVAARGRDAGAALGSDPAAAVAQIAARVVALIDTQDGTELVTTIAGGMRLGDYLPTRTFELAVHTADLATVLGVPPDVPATAAVQALRIVADLAATGRLGLPAGFSVPAPPHRNPALRAAYGRPIQPPDAADPDPGRVVAGLPKQLGAVQALRSSTVWPTCCSPKDPLAYRSHVLHAV